MYTPLGSHNRYTAADWSYEAIEFKSIDIIGEQEFVQHTVRPGHQAVESEVVWRSSLDDDNVSIQSPTNLPAPADKKEPVRKRQGWRFSTTIIGWTATLVCLVNFGFLIHAVVIWDNTGVRPVSEGNCQRISNFGVAAHVIINIISSVLLSASNFCMQCLSSLTRSDIDRQHRRGMWMDVGVSSVRNLSQISSIRFGLWLLLAASSMPLQLLYNAAAFKTISANGYTVKTIASSAINYNMKNGNLDYESLDLPKGLNFTSETAVRNLTTKECITAYGNALISEYSDLLLVVSNPASRLPNGTWTSNDYHDLRDVSVIYPAYRLDTGRWITPDPTIFNSTGATNSIGVLNGNGAMSSLRNPDSRYVSATYSPLSDNGTTPWVWMCPYKDSVQVENVTMCAANLPFNSSNWNIYKDLDQLLNSTGTNSLHVDYCLAQVVEPRCRLLLSVPILAIVVFCNICKIIAIFSTMFLREDMLLAVGDAIASFLDEPDRCTTGLGLISLDDVRQYGTTVRRTGVAGAEPHSANWSLKGKLVGVASIVWLVATIGTTVWLSLTARDGNLPWTTLVSLGFGKVNSGHAFVVRAPTQLDQALLATLLANLPQLWLSMLYLMWNSCCTSMHLAWEYSQFANTRKHLRVTSPCASADGKQRPTYWLTLPLRFSVPLIALSCLTHWLLSLTVFPVMVDLNLRDGSTNNQMWVGYTYAPAVCARMLALAVLCITIYLSSRKLRSPMPVVSCCSWAISAACHRPVDDSRASTKPVQWGDVSGPEEKYGHCTFTSQNVAPLDVNKKYI